MMSDYDRYLEAGGEPTIPAAWAALVAPAEACCAKGSEEPEAIHAVLGCIGNAPRNARGEHPVTLF